MVLLSLRRKIPKLSVKLGHDYFLSHFLNIHVSLRVIIQPELLITQLNELNAIKTRVTNTAEPICTMGNVTTQVYSDCTVVAPSKQLERKGNMDATWHPSSVFAVMK
jgi:hypothetical protein